MRTERSLKLIHTPLLAVITFLSIVTLGLSGYLVGWYNDNGYPVGHGPYKPRIRILLVASIWMTVFGLYLLIGFLIKPLNRLFGVLPHFVITTIGFLLFLIGSAAVTDLQSGINCSTVSGFPRCGRTRSLEIISWIDTILIFATWCWIVFLGFKARKGLGLMKSSLVDAWLA